MVSMGLLFFVFEMTTGRTTDRRRTDRRWKASHIWPLRRARKFVAVAVAVACRPSARHGIRPQLLSKELDGRHTAGVVNCWIQSAAVVDNTSGMMPNKQEAGQLLFAVTIFLLLLSPRLRQGLYAMALSFCLLMLIMLIILSFVCRQRVLEGPSAQ